MTIRDAPRSDLPARKEALVFALKTRLLQANRVLKELGRGPTRHSRENQLSEAPLISETKAPLWTKISPAEFSLTAGKIENIRLVAKKLNGLEIPANQTFSFWKQVGRTTQRKGYRIGRELREGCLVPNIGGGICLISGALYKAALEANFQIVERHAHSRIISGSQAEQNLDSTVFWNYVDLRFQAPFAWRLEVSLDASDLIIQIRALNAPAQTDSLASKPEPSIDHRDKPSGDCLTCNQVACFRHPSAIQAHAPSLGHSAYLLDARWPKFDHWCHNHSQAGDHWFSPLEGKRWNKANYSWSPPNETQQNYATSLTLLQSLRQRRIPAQGAARQKQLIKKDVALAKYYAKRISTECRHLVISQNLLPHLWKLGVIGGRSFDVLIERWPISELQRRLDKAASQHPQSSTLADFRADKELQVAEDQALAAAGRLITPHRAMAAHFGHRAWLIDWHTAEAAPQKLPSHPPKAQIFFPCSPLGRKGVYELSAAMQEIDAELLILGSAKEDDLETILSGISWRQATQQDLPSVQALVLPCWIEHQPRLALRAIAMGIPVVASRASGLPEHPLCHLVDEGNIVALHAALKQAIGISAEQSTRSPSATKASPEFHREGQRTKLR